MKEAMDRALAYSSCRCCLNQGQFAAQMYDALAAGKKSKLDPSKNPFHAADACPNGKHDIIAPSQVNSCVIHWSRNELLKSRRPDDDYVLFVDDDICIEPDWIERLLSHGKDIVAGLCTRRVDPPEPNHRRWMESIQNYGTVLKWKHDGKLLEVDAVGTGLMLISRKVIEEMAARYHPGQYKADGNGWWFEFLKGPWGNELGEDISFCLKASRMGFGVYVDTSVCPMHMGDYNYEISDYLDYQEKVLAAGGLEEYRRQSRVIEQEKVLSRVSGQQTHEQQVEADSVQVLDLAGVGVR